MCMCIYAGGMVWCTIQQVYHQPTNQPTTYISTTYNNPAYHNPPTNHIHFHARITYRWIKAQAPAAGLRSGSSSSTPPRCYRNPVVGRWGAAVPLAAVGGGRGGVRQWIYVWIFICAWGLSLASWVGVHLLIYIHSSSRPSHITKHINTPAESLAASGASQSLNASATPYNNNNNTAAAGHPHPQERRTVHTSYGVGREGEEGSVTETAGDEEDEEYEEEEDDLEEGAMGVSSSYAGRFEEWFGAWPIYLYTSGIDRLPTHEKSPHICTD